MKSTGRKPWAGRFEGSTDPRVDGFGSSIGFDRRLVFQDIAVNRAHGKMLNTIGVLSKSEWEAISTALDEIEKEIQDGIFEFSIELEDVHMNIEAALIAKVGEAGGKIHTARSRNDQVATDLRMFLREGIDEVIAGVGRLQSVLVKLAEKHLDVILPGYTHLQRAQPIRLSHEFLAYFDMLGRDLERFRESRKRTNLSPLGAAALAGTTFPIDRKTVASELGFDGVIGNSLDAVSDRDFVLDFLHAASVLMGHLSRLSEELILWSTQEFGFISLPDRFSTGSSIMPQKKNPDVLELIRGKSARIFGHQIGLLTLIKGLPLAYNKDLQEDKEPVFDTLDTLIAILELLPDLLGEMEVNKDRMLSACRDGFLEATDLADLLTVKGVPFREAHKQVGELVKYCIERKLTLPALSLEEVQQFCPAMDAAGMTQLDIEVIVDRRISFGGTSLAEVKAALQRAKAQGSN